jgi:prepilin-type N-terminal cleavage/methylation domain-containing protein
MIRKLKQIKQCKQNGFTLIELGIVVAIVLLLMAVGLAKAPAILANQRIAADSQEIPQIVTNTQAKYSNRQNFTGVTLDAIIRLDAFPTNRVTIPGAGAATATNRWGGAITFTAGTINTAGDIGRFVYASVPAAECKGVITAVEGSMRRVVVDSANSGTAGAGTVVKADGGQLDNAALGTACSGITNSITYDFTK